MTTSASPDLIALARKAWGNLEPVHALGYFAPEPREAYVALGLDKRLSYFAARSAAFGPARPELTTATFYVFAPWLVAKALPAAWDIASPEQVQQARRDGMSAALRRVLGEVDVAELLTIAKGVCAGLTTPGRPLYAAHSSLPWPEDDLLALWHAATLIREHRGDGHLVALAEADLDPVESLVVGGLFSANTDFVRKTRGWSDEEWSAAESRLRDRGLLTANGDLSDAGHAARQRVEERTDELAVAGWAAIGEEACRRMIELAKPLRTQILADDDMPGWMSGRG